MTPGGFCNRHSRQRAANEKALERFAAAARRVPLDDGPVGLADLGCAQSRDSVAPMRGGLV